MVRFRPGRPMSSTIPKLLLILVLGAGLRASGQTGIVTLVTEDFTSKKPVPARIHLTDAAGDVIRAPDLPFHRTHFTMPGKVTLELKQPAKIDHVIVMENILEGERIREFVVEGLTPGNEWQTLCEGTSVGHKRILRFESTEVAQVRLKVTKQAATPKIRKLAVYDVAGS